MYFVDIQGTLIDDIDKKPIAGAIEFIHTLNTQKIPYVLITNNTKNRSKAFFEYMVSLGFELDFHHYLDPLMVLGERLVHQRIAPFGNDEFLDILKQDGYEFDYHHPQTVVVGLREDYTNKDFATMIELAMGGAKLLGIHMTSIYAKAGRSYPGVGAILKMIEFATGKSFEVVGKPSMAFYEQAKQMIGAKHFEEITIISDDYAGDLVGAKELGMKTVLVLSGKIKNTSQISSMPDCVYSNISEVVI